MKSKIKILILSIFLALFTFQNAHAALVYCGHNADGSDACNISDLENGLVSLIDFLISTATLLAIAYVFYGGVRMVLSRGNPAQFDAAKKTMSHAIQGLIIVLIAYLIVNFAISALTGGKSSFAQIRDLLP